MAKLNFDAAPSSLAIDKVMDKATKESNAKTTIDIPLGEIDMNEDNEKIFNMKDIERLAANIKEEGFFGSIEVFKKGNGRYEIISGHRRYKAMELLGMDTIPAIVASMPEKDTKKRRRLIASNINSRDMTPMDWARAIDYHRQTLIMESQEKYGDGTNPGVYIQKYKEGSTLKGQLESYFGFSPAKIYKYLSLVKLIPELQDLVEDNVIPFYTISSAASEPEHVQIKIYKMIHAMRESLPRDSENNAPHLSSAQVEKIIATAKLEVAREESALQKETEEVSYEKEWAETPNSFAKQVSNTEDEDMSIEEREIEIPEPVKNDTQPYLSVDELETDSLSELETIKTTPAETVKADKEDEEEIVVAPPKKGNPLDSFISSIQIQVSRFITDEYSVSDIDDVKKNIDNIIENLRNIKKSL